MSLPAAYQHEIEALSKEILQSQPTDILQFCANFFAHRLELERAHSLASSPPPHNSMSGHTFPGRLGTNVNPFGAPVTAAGEQTSSGPITQVVEEEENDTITSPTSSSFGFGFGKAGGTTFASPFGGDGPNDGPPSSFKATGGDGFPSNYGMGRRTSVSAESLNPTASANDNWTPPFHQKAQDQLERLKKSISGNFLFNHLDDEQTSQILGALMEKPVPAKGIKVCMNTTFSILVGYSC